MTSETGKSPTSGERSGARVLVVDDEPDFEEIYTLWLSDRYDVLSASCGEEALELLDASIDVILLDRRMPGLSGDEVVTEVRTRSIDCRVVMVTAVEPSLDILDMEFDGYLVKPITKGDLIQVIEEMLERSTYSAEVQDFFALAEKRATLEATLGPDELDVSDEFAQFNERVETAKEKADGALSDLLDSGDETSGFHELMNERNT